MREAKNLIEEWDRDNVQFPRLLAEIAAVGLTSDQKIGIAKSMDINAEKLAYLFGRAEIEWMRIKAKTIDGDKTRCQDCNQIWLTADLDDGDIPHLYERVGPGEPMPDGECPDCGALCQPIEVKSKKRRK